jgi:zinc/manganese transport system permease protein
VTHVLSLAFVQRAFVAGTAVALASGLSGWFVVLRRQVFVGDALGHVAFTGSLAALAFGVDVRAGLFAATILAALVLGRLGSRGVADDVVTGSVFVWVLGLGVLFLSLFTAEHAAGNGSAGVRVLFGSLFGLSNAATVSSVAAAAVVCVAIVAMARPLLFASVDPAVAAARGVHVRALGLAFVGAVGLVAADATPAVGALLVLGLLAAPGGIAHRLTARPYRGLAIAAAVAVGSVWAGLAASYALPRLPASFAIMAVLSVLYASVLVFRRR